MISQIAGVVLLLVGTAAVAGVLAHLLCGRDHPAMRTVVKLDPPTRCDWCGRWIEDGDLCHFAGECLICARCKRADDLLSRVREAV